MLVVSANWGIGDGSLRARPSPATLARFVGQVRRAAVLAGWRGGGRYEPVEGVDVVLAGDTFDWILSREWLGRYRPWQRGAGARETRDRVVASSRSVLRQVLGPLLEAAAIGIDLPRADARSRPDPGRPARVPLRVTLLDGNLDADLGCVLADVAAAIPGLLVGAVWEDAHTRVEHGHRGDWSWATLPGSPSLGASLRIDLLGRFLLSPAVAALAPAARRSLADSLSSTDGAAWTEPFVGCQGDGARDALEQDWRAAVAAWRRAAGATGVEGDVPFDHLDAIADALLDGAPLRQGIPSVTDAAIVRADIVGACALPAWDHSGRSTVVLGHPHRRSSRPCGVPRVECLGGSPVAGEASVRGVHEVGAEPPDIPWPLVAPGVGSPPPSSAPFTVPTVLAEWGAGRGGGRPARGEGRFRVVEAA